ncbi:MAG: RNA polymerase sigma factor [bacterium]
MVEIEAVDVDRESRFVDFVDAHQERAVRVAWRLLGGDAAAAEDVAQEAFLKAHRGLAQFRDDAALSTWFYRILLNEARSYRRWRAVRRRWTALWTAEDSEPVASTPLPDPALQRRIAIALETLSPGQREVFVLVYLEGLTLEQCAVQLGKALGTVKAHLHRALHTLRGELQDLHEAPTSPKRVANS